MPKSKKSHKARIASNSGGPSPLKELPAALLGFKWKKGQRPVGRGKGTPNKFTRLIRDAILESGVNVGDFLHSHTRCESMGLVGYLEWLALKFPPAYAALLAKVLPTQTTVTVEDNRREPYASFEEVRQAMIRKGIPPQLVERMPRLTFTPLDDDDVMDLDVTKQ